MDKLIFFTQNKPPICHIKGFPLILIFLLLPFRLSYGQDTNLNEIITEEKVTDIIETLSSDEMSGRKAFTPSIQKTAKFISDKFDEIGLEPLNLLDSYRQNFTVYQLTPNISELIVNGTEIAASEYFYTGNNRSADWKISEKDVQTVSSTDNFGQLFSEYNQSENDLVVLVAPSHQDIFHRYGSYFRRGSRTFSIDEGPTRLFILLGSDIITSGSFSMKQNIKRQEAFNVVGKITGSRHPNEYVLFSAHYDHVGILQPVKGDSIANGADDNASGTTAVLLLAEYFKKIGPHPRTLIFAGFTAEEAGGYGSKYFSRQMDPDKVVAMFNIEMIGKPSKFGPNTAFMTGFLMTDMGSILQDNLEDTGYMIHPDPYPEQNLFFRSDNATLARLGVPAHTFSSVQIDKDPYYHTVDDELQTLNMEHLTNMIKAVALSSRSIVNGEDTPNRIDPEKLK